MLFYASWGSELTKGVDFVIIIEDQVLIVSVRS